MKASSKCINLIKNFEGCRLTAYKDSVGVWTIGYGHTSGVKKGQVISQSKAEDFLKSDLARYEKNVDSFTERYHWNQNQFDALVSFAYNIGSINQLTANGTRTIEQISEKITAYNKAGGKVLEGLTRRRKAEKELFDTQIEPAKNSTATSPATAAKPKNTFKSYKATVSAKSGLVVRKEASSSSARLGALSYGTTVTIKSHNNGWGKVTVAINKKIITGWIYLRYIKPV